VTPAAPIVPAPPPARGPLSQSLNGAYRAIVNAAPNDPGAAARASFLYADARERARRGDVSGALASAAAAWAEALAPSAPRVLAPAVPLPYAPAVQPAPAAAAPLAAEAASLPADLLVARNELLLAERLQPGASLAGAKRCYRSALDAYLGGNAEREAAQARAAFDLAAEAIAKAK